MYYITVYYYCVLYYCVLYYCVLLLCIILLCIILLCIILLCIILLCIILLCIISYYCVLLLGHDCFYEAMYSMYVCAMHCAMHVNCTNSIVLIALRLCPECMCDFMHGADNLKPWQSQY